MVKKVLIFILLVGVALIAFPRLAVYFNGEQQTGTSKQYVVSAGNLTDDKTETLWNEALNYNKQLAGSLAAEGAIAGSGYILPANYHEILNIDGILGNISIPSIDLELPIYHGTENDVLKKGIGHLEGSALPLGEGGHSYLTGHNGLVTTELFTKLDEVVLGDTFQITVLNRELTYEVDDIQVISPEEFDTFKATFADKENIVTLITCTPYGVNSHRLLVSGSFKDSHILTNELSEIESTPAAVPSDIDTKVLIGVFILGIIITVIGVWGLLKS